MRARVPYLARLAQQTAGQATLRPPLRPFADDGYPPVQRPDRDAGPPPEAAAAGRGGWPIPFPPPPGDDPGDVPTPQATELTASPRGGDRGVARAGGDLDAPVVPVAQQPIIPVAPGPPPARTTPAAPTTAAALPTAPPSPSAPSAVAAELATAPGAMVSPAASPATRAEAGDAAAPVPVTQAESAHVAVPVQAVPVQAVPVQAAPVQAAPAGVALPARAEMSAAEQRMEPLPAGGAAQARPPTTWSSALWDGPVDLTHVITQPTAGGTGAPVTAEPPSRRAAPTPGPTPGPGSGTTADPDPGQRTGGSAAPGVRHQAPGQLAPPAPAAPGYLLPPPARTPDPVPALGPEPSGPSRKPDAQARPGVSIGTIEVTVVPPAPPLPEPPRAQASRPVPKLAGSAGTGRLRDGLRRWYGTAQG